eukprot:SAG31_NODE_15577_length_748_cov_0.926040_1_plen_233_part_01
MAHWVKLAPLQLRQKLNRHGIDTDDFHFRTHIEAAMRKNVRACAVLTDVLKETGSMDYSMTKFQERIQTVSHAYGNATQQLSHIAKGAKRKKEKQNHSIQNTESVEDTDEPDEMSLSLISLSLYLSIHFTHSHLPAIYLLGRALLDWHLEVGGPSPQPWWVITIPTRSKRFRTAYHWIKEHVRDDDVCLRDGHSATNLADFLTKNLQGPAVREMYATSSGYVSHPPIPPIPKK